jgi:hypothetical protein
MKMSGLRVGVPDLMLAFPQRWKDGTNDVLHSGLFIEMKRAERSAKPSKDQLDMIVLLSRAGYKCVVCRGFVEAQRAIMEYLSWSI